MTKVLKLEVDDVKVNLVVRHATVGDAMQRGILTARVADTEYASEAERAVALMVYPRCLACTEGVVEQDSESKNVRELSVSEFISLPYEIGEAWLAAVLEENPGWSLQAEVNDSAQKKD